jgi:hypothetical protein
MLTFTRMERVEPDSPTPEPPSHPQRVYVMQPGQYGLTPFPEHVTPQHPHQMAHGRMAMPMSSSLMSATPTHDPRSAPLHYDDHTPYHPHHPHIQDASPYMMNGHALSPTDHINMNIQMQQMMYQQPIPQFRSNPPRPSSRPQLQRNHTVHVGPPPRHHATRQHAHMQGQRPPSPHMMGGDIFDPAPRPHTANGSPTRRGHNGYVMEQHSGYGWPPELQVSWNGDMADGQFYQPVQGISPARALGPAPLQPQHFSPHRDDVLITPLGSKSIYHTMPSSATSIATSSSLTASTHTGHRRPSVLCSDDEAESPTRSRRMSSVHYEEHPIPPGMEPLTRPPSAQGSTRPQRPPKTTSGGRTSAKFAKVADDPGVEGVPPGFRPLERPGPSFASIIGQAILKCAAGGLSLEHIYRYVEAAWPYFRAGDGAWRNSVRHNLSIHKMFETIPRTEKFPPGKGGIWIIHEDEKIHWPEDGKFIKNFPSSHPHHAVCRQTVHEREKEQDAMAKAAAEGREYIPKKGKKGRKIAARDEELSAVMRRSSSSAGEGSKMITPKADYSAVPPIPTEEDCMVLEYREEEMAGPSEDHSTRMLSTSPIAPVVPLVSREEKMARGGIMAPPSFGHKRKLVEDEDNVFTVPKRVRLAPMPTTQPQSHDEGLDDSFITPERERPVPSVISNSAFKTPALVNTSSSPGSSPMPLTATRSANHHPSGLQQGWTQDDVAAPSSSSPGHQMLDSAFDFQPKSQMFKTLISSVTADDIENFHTNQLRGPPKTPISRSSAAFRTPKAQSLRTPMIGESPGMFPCPSALLTTPVWSVLDIIHRMGTKTPGDCDSPTMANVGVGGDINEVKRSPMIPPTSPNRYAMQLDNGSPKKGKSIAKDLTSL